MATATERITPRKVMRDVLGLELADSLMTDMGVEWTLTVAVCAIESRGGPTDEKERLFMEWADRVTRE